MSAVSHSKGEGKGHGPSFGKGKGKGKGFKGGKKGKKGGYKGNRGPPAAVQKDDDDEVDQMVKNGRAPPEMVRPCDHNAWDDVRTRRHAKILQCRTCLAKWKLPMPVPRCSYFLHGHCEKADTCHMLHVFKKKAEKEKPPEENPADDNTDDNDAILLLASVKSAPGGPSTWRNWFPEEDIGHLAMSEGGSKYGLIEPGITNKGRPMTSKNLAQVSPTSSAEPPPLMSPTPHTPSETAPISPMQKEAEEPTSPLSDSYEATGLASTYQGTSTSPVGEEQEEPASYSLFAKTQPNLTLPRSDFEKSSTEEEEEEEEEEQEEGKARPGPNEGVHAMTEDELDAHLKNWEKN